MRGGDGFFEASRPAYSRGRILTLPMLVRA
jgi:hypothetical protein